MFEISNSKLKLKEVREIIKGKMVLISGNHVRRSLLHFRFQSCIPHIISQLAVLISSFIKCSILVTDSVQALDYEKFLPIKITISACHQSWMNLKYFGVMFYRYLVKGQRLKNLTVFNLNRWEEKRRAECLGKISTQINMHPKNASNTSGKPCTSSIIFLLILSGQYDVLSSQHARFFLTFRTPLLSPPPLPPSLTPSHISRLLDKRATEQTDKRREPTDMEKDKWINMRTMNM